MDNLSKDMIQCKKDGFDCHYGAWKATQDPVKIEKKDIPDGWRACAYCGIPFKPKTKRKQLYCGGVCQKQAYTEKIRKAKEGANNG
jgi:hypothetical protein